MIEKLPDGTYQCKTCGKVCISRNKTSLKDHVETHIDGLSFPCQYCGKVFRSRKNLTTHAEKDSCLVMIRWCNLRLKKDTQNQFFPIEWETQLPFSIIEIHKEKYSILWNNPLVSSSIFVICIMCFIQLGKYISFLRHFSDLIIDTNRFLVFLMMQKKRWNEKIYFS